jgi:hypothetical protein
MPSSSGMRRLFASGPLQAVAMRSRHARQKCECFFIYYFVAYIRAQGVQPWSPQCAVKLDQQNTLHT